MYKYERNTKTQTDNLFNIQDVNIRLKRRDRFKSKMMKCLTYNNQVYLHDTFVASNYFIKL